MKTISYLTIMAIIAGCSWFEGPEGKISLLDVSDEPSGQNCLNGGIKISAGIDSNKNGVLDSNEITATKYVCNGANGQDGLNSLISIEEISSSIICLTGGIKISSGIDSNKNGLLDSEEITSTKVVCNGADGADGVNSLISTKSLPSGAICSNGGIEVNSGKDSNRNGILDDSEIKVTEYICDGLDGLLDKQIRFKLPFLLSFDGTEKITNDPAEQNSFENNIYNFNIQYFPNVDSAMYTAWIGVPDLGNKCTLELYNLTDNVPISGSQIIANSPGTTDFLLHQSGNVVNGFPQKEITIGLRIKGEIPGKYVNAVNGDLYLFRK